MVTLFIYSWLHYLNYHDNYVYVVMVTMQNHMSMVTVFMLPWILCKLMVQAPCCHGYGYHAYLCCDVGITTVMCVHISVTTIAKVTVAIVTVVIRTLGVMLVSLKVTDSVLICL
jgi:hypothetical protein